MIFNHNLNCRWEASSLRFAYPSGERSRDRRNLQVRQHYSSPVQYYQTKDYCADFVSLYNQIVSTSRVASTMHTTKHNRSSDDHGGGLASSFSCWSCRCLCHVGITLGTMPAPCLAGRRYDVAVTQLDERQASTGSLWSRPATSWVGTGRTLWDSPVAAQGALGSALDRHHYSQHTFSALAKKLVCSGVGFFSFFVLLGNK